MKTTSIILFIVSFIFLGFSIQQNRSAALIRDSKMVQVGVIVKDINQSAENWAKFLGLEKIPKISVAQESEKNPTTYLGKKTNAGAKLAFIKLENITIELIEPLGGESTWQHFLDTKGEGIHHIAFDVEDMDQKIALFQENGIPLQQHGGWSTGEYSYMDGSQKLGLIIELLEHYNK